METEKDFFPFYVVISFGCGIINTSPVEWFSELDIR